MIFKGIGKVDEPLTYEEAEKMLSQAILDLKRLADTVRIRNPEGHRVRVERYQTLIDYCMGYCYLQIYSEIRDIRSELTDIVKGETT